MVYVKDGATKRFVIVDAAMNDLIRPALYEAWHDIVPVRLPGARSRAGAGRCRRAGLRDRRHLRRPSAICRRSPKATRRVDQAGAYGAVMSSTYNSRLLVPEVLVAGDRFAVIRARPSYEAMLALDTIPEWLDAPGRPGRTAG